MDPSKLSMQEGKAFLRQLGIPQRDVDKMTEKWVVIAAVEVLLRFPLQPGEDPSTHCATSGKAQPSPPGRALQRLGDPARRKSQKQLLRESDKPQDSPGRPGPHMHRGPQRPPNAQNPKQLASGPGWQMAPPVEETRVRCKGDPTSEHPTSSRASPTKRPPLSPQPLSAHEQKENVESRKQEKLAPRPRVTSLFQKAASACRDDREGTPGWRQEEQWRKVLPQKCLRRPHEGSQSGWRKPGDLEEPCPFRRQPTRPLPVPTTKRSILGPVREAQPPATAPSARPRCPTQPHEGVPKHGAGGSAVRREAGFAGSAHPAAKNLGQDPRAHPEATAHRADVLAQSLPPSARRVLAPDGVWSSQAQITFPAEDSKARQLPVPPKCGQNSTFSFQTGDKRPPPVPSQIRQNPPKETRLSLF